MLSPTSEILNELRRKLLTELSDKLLAIPSANLTNSTDDFGFKTSWFVSCTYANIPRRTLIIDNSTMIDELAIAVRSHNDPNDKNKISASFRLANPNCIDDIIAVVVDFIGRELSEGLRAAHEAKNIMIDAANEFSHWKSTKSN